MIERTFPGAQVKQKNNAAGIAAMLAAQALLVGSDTCIKLVSDAVSPWQFMAVRGVMTIAILGALVTGARAWRAWPMLFKPLILLRACIEAAIALLFITAIAQLTLGEITVLIQTTPLILTLLSAILLGEIVRAQAWTAVLLGLAGVVLVVQPGLSEVKPSAFLALGVAVLLAVRDLITSRLDARAPSILVTFSGAVFVCLLGAGGLPFVTWQVMDEHMLLLTAGSAVSISLATYLLVRAFRDVDVSVVSPFRYVVMVWAMGAGYLVWGDMPNALALFGAAVIVLSGLVVMDRRKARSEDLDGA